MYKWLARKIEPYLIKVPEIASPAKVGLSLQTPPIQIHDAIVIRPGDMIVLFERNLRESGFGHNFSWLVMDFSDFGFGTLTLKVELLFPGQSEHVVYFSRTFSSDEVERQAWDLQLPPSEGIRVHMGLTSGRNTRIAYHFYCYPFAEMCLR